MRAAQGSCAGWLLLAAAQAGSPGLSWGVSGGLSAPLLSANATFVLISGLAGDAESESAYQQQMGAWLDILSKLPGARSCVAFCDQPEAISPPATLPTQVFKAEREQVLALPERLGAMTGPLRVIIWGHGGKQGANPVLHVRGPRLTPADFTSLCRKLPEVPSQWCLMFRGSGAFARALAAPNREVLASDDEVMFGSDPNGMPLLLKSARAHPEAPFARLAEELSRATMAWYSERRLAATEEPTLWADGQGPRHLAEHLEATTDPAATQEQAQPTAPVASSQQSSDSPPRGVMPASGWNELKKVRREDFPNCDAVVLSSRQISVLGTSPALTTEREEFIQILTPEGKRYGDFDVLFAPPEEELEFLDCEVMRPDGRVERLDPESIGMAGEHSPEEYQSVRRKFFSLPGVGPGAVLHVRYRSQWQDYPLPRISMEIPLARDVPVAQATVLVKCPKGSGLQYDFQEVSPVEPVLEQTEYSTSYRWNFTKVAAAAREPLMPPHRRPALLISTFADWHTFAGWYSRITQLAGEVTPELENKARELTREAKTPREKVEALFNYVTRLRYVAIPLGINSLRPHSAAIVLENQFGDCKDKANLLNALLHALNIEADLVLVPRFGQARQRLPGLWFNHAISRVRAGEEIFWVDSTDGVCRFGLLPPGDAGRNVLVIDGRTTSLTQLGTSDASYNHLTIRGHIGTAESGEGCLTDLKAQADGYPDYQLRSASDQEGQGSGLPALLSAAFRPVAGSFAVEQQSATPVSQLDQPFVWQGKGHWLGLTSGSNGKSALHCPLWIPREWDLALNLRKHPLFLAEGYPFSLDEEFEIALPADQGTEELPPAQAGTQPPLLWRVEWKQNARGLVVHFHAELSRAELTASETESFRGQLHQLLQASASDAVLSGPLAAPDSFKASQN